MRAHGMSFFLFASRDDAGLTPLIELLMSAHLSVPLARRVIRLARFICLALVVSACADRATAPYGGVPALAPASEVASRGDAPPDVGSVVRWNALARQLVAEHKIAPPIAARLYTYLGIAQDRAAGARQHDDEGDDEFTGSSRAAINAASSSVLTHILVTELKFAAAARIIDAEWEAQQRSKQASQQAGEAPLRPPLWARRDSSPTAPRFAASRTFVRPLSWRSRGSGPTASEPPRRPVTGTR